MRRIFLFIAIFLSLGTSARENYILYHKEILRCEQQFLYFDHITAALKDYKVVFEKYKKPFAKDCFAAAQLACYTNDKSSAEYFLRLSFQRGISWTAVIMSEPARRLLENDPLFQKKVAEIYATAHPVYQRTINVKLRDEVIRMKKRDDSFKYRINYETQTKPEATKHASEYQQIRELNTLAIVSLTRAHGFLGDNLVGYMDYSASGEEYRRLYCYSLRSLIDQLFYHHPCCYFLLQNELKTALEEGEILPAMYASIYEWAYLDLKEKGKDLDICIETSDQCDFYNICPVFRFWNLNRDTALVDRCRSAIGMASTDHYRRRKEFQKQTGVKLLYGMFEHY